MVKKFVVVVTDLVKKINRRFRNKESDDESHHRQHGRVDRDGVPSKQEPESVDHQTAGTSGMIG
jgi:hypothetical protein